MCPFQTVISHVFSHNIKDASWEVNMLPTVYVLDGSLRAQVLLPLVLTKREVLLVDLSQCVTCSLGQLPSCALPGHSVGILQRQSGWSWGREGHKLGDHSGVPHTEQGWRPMLRTSLNLRPTWL